MLKLQNSAEDGTCLLQTLKLLSRQASEKYIYFF